MKVNPIRSLPRQFFPYLVLFTGLLVTALTTFYATRAERSKSRLQFESLADKSALHLETYVRHHITLLRAGSLFCSSPRLADSCAQVRIYSDQIQFQKNYPGVQAFGLIARLNPDERRQLEQGRSFSNIQVWPNYPRAEYFPVVTIEPLDEHSRVALGYDISTDPVRRQAMVEACDSGSPAVTGKITLVQDAQTNKQTGFLILQPLYRNGKTPPATQRRQELTGFLYCAFRISDIMANVLARNAILPQGVRIYDSPETSPSHLLYSSLSTNQVSQPARFECRRTVSIGNHTWHIVFSSMPEFDPMSIRGFIFVIPILGFLLSSLLFIYLQAEENARRLAESQSAELLKSEALLRESAARFRTLVNNAPVTIWEAGPDKNCVFINQTGLQFIGRSLENLQNHNLAKDVHPEDLERLREVCATAFRDQQQYSGTYRMRRFDGQFRWLWFTAIPLRGEDEKFLGYIGSCVDVTEQESAQESLRASEELYRVIAETAADGVITLDHKTTILSANEAIKRIFGYQPTEIVGQSLELLIPDLFQQRKTGIPEFLERQIPQTSCKDVQITGKHQDGSELHLELSLGCATKSGTPFLIGIIRDVSQRKRMQQAIFHVQKMQAIGSLASGIAHDFNNVFTAILSHLELALISDPNEGKEYLGYVKTSAGRGAELVQRLLTFSRQSAGKTTQINLDEMMKDTMALLQRSITRRIEITSTIAANVWPIKGDESLIKQVVINLCLNARDAMPEGGKMAVVANNVIIPPETHVPPKRAGDFIQISVSDTGPGMSKQVIERIFEPYFTTKEFGKGSGLGLSIANNIVTEAGGWIEVESKAGNGSKFHVFLPRCISSPEQQAIVVGPSVKSKATLEGTETIIVADDDYMVRNLMRAVLAYRGYKIIEANDGAEAVQKAVSEEANLLLLDLEMPQLDGWQALAEIRKTKQALPVILCSGAGVTEDFERKAKEMGASRILSKPFTNPELLRTVRETLDAQKKSN